MTVKNKHGRKGVHRPVAQQKPVDFEAVLARTVQQNRNEAYGQGYEDGAKFTAGNARHKARREINTFLDSLLATKRAKDIHDAIVEFRKDK